MKTSSWSFVAGIAALCLGSSLTAQGAQAPAFPARPIGLVIATAPGASADLTARMLAKSATEQLGQQVIPENNTGGGGFTPMAKLYNAKPDGYNLGVFAFSLVCLEPLMRKAPFDPEKFTPILTYGSYTFMLAVKAEAPWKTMKDLVEDMRKNPGKIKMSTTRPYSLPNFSMFILKDQEKLDFVLVPFEGGAPALASTLGGHTDAILSAGSANPYIKEGKMRALANLGSERSPAFPDVPTLKEAGYNVPGVESGLAIYAPPGLPKNIVKKLEDTFRKGMETKEFINVAKGFEFNTFFWNGEKTHAYYLEMKPKLKNILVMLGKLKE